MRELFNDILSIEGVKGLILFSFEGDVIFQEIDPKMVADIDTQDWRMFIEALAGMRETDLIFEKGRLYIRRTGMGFLVVLIGSFVPISMMRLQCDILLPSLKPPQKGPKGIRRFFKK